VHVSNALGTVNPVAELCALAKRFDVPVLVDGAQATPHETGRCPGLGL
jgi:cysteine desulfurase / selenocysteine lyase